jgi:hypothetical protein
MRGATLCAIAVVIVALTWYPSPHPKAGFDPSWQIALHLIAAEHLHFGSDVVFTYGPLGFVLFPQTVTGTTWAIAFVVTFVLRALLVLLVIGATRRATGHIIPAVAAGYVCAATLGPLVTIPGMLAGLSAIVLIQQPPTPRRLRWMVACALGAAAAACLLIKLDGGVIATISLGLAAWFQGPRGVRALGQFVGGYAVAFVGGWLATGNRLSDIPAWLRWSRHMVSGYTEGAMFTDARVGPGWHFTVFFGALALVVVGAWWSWRGRTRAERLALWTVLGLICWVEFKHGFVRHDTHVAGTLLAIGLVPLTLRWRRRYLGWVALAASSLGLVGALNAMDSDPWKRLQPTGARELAHETRMLVDPARRRHAIAQARAAVRRELAIDPAVIDAIGEGPVHVAPQETSAVWAYDLNWRPLPQFQSFSTWTGGLDRLNAARLESPDGPPVVLRQSTARLDRHNPVFESPQENMALICDYRQVRMVGRWEVLRRTENRCGAERLLATVRVRGTESVTIPTGHSDELVFARIRWNPGLVWRVRSFIYRPSTMPEIALPEGPSLQTYRIPRALLGGPLLLHAPDDLVLPHRLRQVLDLRTIRLVHLDGATVDFFARTVTPYGP